MDPERKTRMENYLMARRFSSAGVAAPLGGVGWGGPVGALG